MKRTCTRMGGLAVGALAALALAAPAMAADLSAYTKAPALVSPAYNWSGFYAGVSVGYAKHNSAYTDINGFNEFDLTSTTSSNGAIGGVQIGYNVQSGSLVYGIEADFSGLSNNRSEHNLINFGGAGLFGINKTNAIDWLGTVRGRLGLAVDRTLIYGTAGVAFGHVQNRWGFSNDNPPTFDDPNHDRDFVGDTTRVGFVVGGGLEHAFAPNWTAKAEALYVDLGSYDVRVDPAIADRPFTTRFDNSLVIVRAGVNYKFGSPGLSSY